MMRIAIVGSGQAAANYHNAVKRVSDAQSVVWGGDCGGLEPDESVGGMLDSLITTHAEAFDAVVLCNAVASRSDELRQLIGFGKHVLSGFPLGKDAAEVRDLHEYAVQNDVTLVTQRLEQSHPYFQAIHNALSSGRLGAPGLLRIHDWKPAASTELDDVSQFRWLESQVALTSGIFEEVADHLLALPIRGDDGLCGIQLHLGFPSGGMALVDGGHFLPVRTSGYLSLSLIAARGAAYADDQHNSHLSWDDQGCAGLPMVIDVDTYVQQLRFFIECVGDSQASSAEQDCQAVVAANGAVASLAAQQVAVCRGEHYELG